MNAPEVTGAPSGAHAEPAPSSSEWPPQSRRGSQHGARPPPGPRNQAPVCFSPGPEAPGRRTVSSAVSLCPLTLHGGKWRYCKASQRNTSNRNYGDKTNGVIFTQMKPGFTGPTSLDRWTAGAEGWPPPGEGHGRADPHSGMVPPANIPPRPLKSEEFYLLTPVGDK